MKVKHFPDNWCILYLTDEFFIAYNPEEDVFDLMIKLLQEAKELKKVKP